MRFWEAMAEIWLNHKLVMKKKYWKGGYSFETVFQGEPPRLVFVEDSDPDSFDLVDTIEAYNLSDDDYFVTERWKASE